jgi:hypothetical protein
LYSFDHGLTSANVPLVSLIPKSDRFLIHLATLKEEIKKRNNFIHRLQGTSEIKHQEQISATMRHILKKVADIPQENLFDRLNQQIIEQLSLATS